MTTHLYASSFLLLSLLMLSLNVLVSFFLLGNFIPFETFHPLLLTTDTEATSVSFGSASVEMKPRFTLLIHYHMTRSVLKVKMMHDSLDGKQEVISKCESVE